MGSKCKRKLKVSVAVVRWAFHIKRRSESRPCFEQKIICGIAVMFYEVVIYEIYRTYRAGQRVYG